MSQPHRPSLGGGECLRQSPDAEALYVSSLVCLVQVSVFRPYDLMKAIAGVRISRQGVQILTEYIDKRTDPRNQTYYWQGMDMQKFGEDSRIDGSALNQNFISITPVKCDMTDYRALEDLAGWDLEILGLRDSGMA